MFEVWTYCSSAGGAWTDLISNATNIAPDDASDDPRPWLREIPGGAAHVGAFIHEFTHHWCFNSVVGAAMATVAHRARLTATSLLMQREQSPEGDDDELDLIRQYHIALGVSARPSALAGEPSDVLRGLLVGDLLRLDMAAMVLRPLAEGLALFAEFDAATRLESKAWSPIPMVLAVYFAGLDDERRRLLPEPLATMYRAGDVLNTYRLDWATVIKKADLLAEPLASARDGGYLAGYLAVKSMWRHLCWKHSRLWPETDLALALLRSYFYDDPVLARLILATGDPGETSSAVANRVKRRINEFDRIQSDDIIAFEQYLIDKRGPTDGPRTTPGILVDGSDDAMARITEVLDALQRDELGWTVGDISRIMQRRREVTLTSVPVTIERRGPGRFGVKWAGEWIDDLRDEDWLDVPEPKSGDARLEVVGTLSGDRLFHRAAFVTVEGKPLACRPFGRPSELAAIRTEMLDTHRARAHLLSRTETLRWFVEKLIEDHSSSAIYVEYIRSQIPDIVDRLYRDTALWFAVDTTAIDRCAALMTDDGFAALLASPDLLEGLALAGLATSINPDESFLRQQFERFDLDFDDTVAAVAACRATHGFPPPIRKDSHGQYFTVI